MKRWSVLAVSVFACVQGAFAQGPEIINSDLRSLQLWVRPGEVLKITNSEICKEAEAGCTLFIDRGARLEAANVVFGEGLTIYHADSADQALELGNADVLGRLAEGAPGYAAELKLPSAGIAQLAPKEVVNSKLSSFNRTLRPGEGLKLINTEICIKDGERCTITVEHGTELDFSNGTLGRGLTIAHTLPLASGISFHSTDFPGQFRQVNGTASPVREVERFKEENRRVAAALSGKQLMVTESARGVTINLPDVYFEFDKSELTQDAAVNVGEIARILSGVSARKIAVEGHTDSVGSDDYNQSLSEKRAQTVRRSLAESGIPGTRLRAVGFGERQPAADNSTDLGRARNRRVEVVLENTAASSTDDATHDLNRSAARELGTSLNSSGKHVESSGRHISVPKPSADQAAESSDEVQIDQDGIRVRSGSKNIEVSPNGIHVNDGGR